MLTVVAVSLVISALAACTTDNGSNGHQPPPRDGGAADPGPGGILITASGEVLALGGYGFPPADGATSFVDGWEVRFARVLVTIDKVTFSENPDRAPGDQSQTEGIVAEVLGPWAVDLHAGGPLAGKGGGDERAIALASVTSQNKTGGAPFDPTKRYAFGFDLVQATSSATMVNLDADAAADYADMVQNGYVVLYVGTATFKGGTSCTSPTTSYDFSKLPSVVSFRFGFKSPTSYVNCQNPDNDPAKPFDGEEHERGVQVKANESVIAQVTVHTDHPFWESVVHDSPAHFDPIAARLVGAGVDAGTATVRLEDLVGVDFSSFKDGAGVPLPWRSCVPTYTAKAGTMGFDAQSVPVNPGAPPDQALRDYRDFMTYDQSTQGHLNADGLCFVKRNYASPR